MMPVAEREIRLLNVADIADAMRLKEQAGWNQTMADWHRLLRLQPGGCLAFETDGRVVATTTTTIYGADLAWIGMVLVNAEYRRRGIANRLVLSALNQLGVMNVKTIKLDATPEGHRVYENLGFEVELVIERWMGTARRAKSPRRLRKSAPSLASLLRFDRRAFGADRSRLLTGLIEDSCVAPSFVVSDSHHAEGYALARRGTRAFYVGPVVAKGRTDAAGLLDDVLTQLAGHEVYIDVNTTFAGAAEELSARGFIKQRELIRMRYGQVSSAGTSDRVFAIAGPEVG